MPFLAARPEVYGFMLLVSLFPTQNLIVGWQFVFFFIWWGAAASKLNRHFPYVISVMISNTPWNRSRKAKAKLYEDYPEDLRPGQPGGAAGRTSGPRSSSACRWCCSCRGGGTIGTIAVIGMIIFHVHITSTFALGVPMEWNLFMIFGLLFLFGQYGDVPLSNLDDPLLIVVLCPDRRRDPGARQPLPGEDLVPARRCATTPGNWATSLWLFRKAPAPRRSSTARSTRSRRSRSSSSRSSTTARRPSYILEKGARVPRACTATAAR